MYYSINIIVRLVLGCIGILVTIGFSNLLSNHRISSKLAVIGSLSLQIYILHIFFGSGVRIAMSKVFSINSLYLHVLVGTSFGILLPVIAYRIFSTRQIALLFRLDLKKADKDEILRDLKNEETTPKEFLKLKSVTLEGTKIIDS
jgi:peptidoglycan/LPS O-acetylase OafA/YrhL